MSTPTIIRQGSSPLTRGKHEGKCRGLLRLGLIPAHAGKTGQRHASSSSPRAHPRSRGENGDKAFLVHVDGGSSPLTRGKRPAGGECPCEPRLIPAHAGKTCGWRFACVVGGAHPRSRGENLPLSWDPPIDVGSSPLTRGKLLRLLGARRGLGLIPAHAGKTRFCFPVHRLLRAHPRSRGENHRAVLGIAVQGGSSPLTRGKHVAVGAGLLTWGLIPAHAGKTGARRPWSMPRGAHPRSRGENRVPGNEHVGALGSSPLTRGKQPPPLQ